MKRTKFQIPHPHFPFPNYQIILKKKKKVSIHHQPNNPIRHQYTQKNPYHHAAHSLNV
jgi:hypothetical protein